MSARRRSNRFLSLFVSLLVVLTGTFGASGRALATTLPPDWVPVGRPDFSGAAGYYTSVALDAQGAAYVAFMDFANSNKATVMKHPGPGPDWVVVGAPGFSAGQVRSLQLVLDGNGTPYVAYSDFVNQYRATVMKYNGTSWVNVGLAGFSAGDIGAISLAVDATGTPYVAYIDNSFAGSTVVMKFDSVGGTWMPVGNPPASPPATTVSLALDKLGTPYIAFDDSTAPVAKATVMSFSGTKGWQVVGKADFSANRVSYVSLAISSTGVPYVAYADWITSTTTQVSVMNLNAQGSWQTVGPTSFGTGPVYFVGLKLGSDDMPLVVYKDGGLAGRATVMRYNGSSWLAIGGPGFTPGLSDNTTMVLDSGNNPYVGFTDWSHGGKASAMRYSLDGKIQPVVTMTLASGYTLAPTGWFNRASSGSNGIAVEVTSYSPYGILSLSCTDNGYSVLDTGMDHGTFPLGDGDHKVTCVAGDGAGTVGAGAGSTAMPVHYPVDQAPPVVKPVVSPNPVTVHTSATVDAGATDAVSGIASQSCGSLDTSTVGTKSVSCSASDVAGNSGTGSTTYTVSALPPTATPIPPPTVVPPPTPVPSGWKTLYLPILMR